MAGDATTALQGETLDALIWRARGLAATDLPVVLQLNPGLAARGAALPEGLVVRLPAAPASTAVLPLIQLWD